ncbi:hypothetical protein V1281_002564 [Nitrobacteraceae bacterium AZCC 2161]
MTALLKLFGFWPSDKQSEPTDNLPAHEISQDQIDYAHELADERRRAWASAKLKN